MKDINLLPEETARGSSAEIEEKEIKKSLPATTKSILIAGIVFIIILITYAAPLVYIKIVKMQITSIQEDLKSEEFNKVRQVKAQNVTFEQRIKNKKNIMNDVENKNAVITDLISIIKESVPEGCVVNAITYKGNIIRVSGQAITGMVATEFLYNIDRLEYLEAQSLSDTMSIENINEKYDFDFTFAISGKEGK